MATVEWEDGEELISELPSVRHAKKDGVLYLTNQRIAWMEYGAPTFKISHSYSQLKSQKISPETSSKVQLQIVLYEGPSATFHFTKPSEALQERNMVKDMLVRLIQQHKPKPNKELEEKTRILNGDPALFQLYKDLVVSGMLSAEEFWVNQKKAPDGQVAEDQPTGISSATLAELEPQVDGANAVKYTLTPDSIQAIFKTYPAVAKIHKENVPDKMTEKQFWEQFFVSYYFHHERSSSKVPAKKKDIISQSALQDEKDLLAQCIGKMGNPLVDLTAESAESELAEGYGAGLHSHRALEASALPSGPIPIIRKFNHQSMMILKAREESGGKGEDSQAKKAKLLRDAVQFTELEESVEDSGMLLRIRNVKNYAEGPTSQKLDVEGSNENHTDMKECRKHMKAFIDDVKSWRPDRNQIISSELACQALADLAPGGALSQQSLSSQYVMSQEIQEELLRQHNALGELLRHFWLCFPVTSKFLEEKVIRMATCLQNYREVKLAEFKRFLAAEEQQLATPLEQMIQSAIDKYSAWATRKAKGKKKNVVA